MGTNSRIGNRYSQNRPSNIILPRSKTLSVQSIKTWKDALTLAQLPEEPNRLPLLQIYESILIDGHLESILESRILKILSSKFKIVNDKGEENEDLTRLIKKKWFIQFLTHSMWARFMGTTVIELWDLNDDMELAHVGLIPRENTLPRPGLIVKEVGDQKGYPYREGSLVNYYIQIGDNDDLGKLALAAPDPLTKKYAKAAWAEYVEKYGIPPRVVTTDSHNDARHQELADMMAGMVSNHWAVLQGNEKLEMMHTTSVDAHQTFDSLIQRMNSEMSKRILGQDGTTDSKDTKGTFGSLKVMQEVADDRHESDKTFIEYLINDELLWRLQQISGVYGGFNGHRFEWDDSKELAPEDIIDMATKLGTAGYIVDPLQIEEKTGLKIVSINPSGGGSDEDIDPETGEKKKPKLNAAYWEDMAAYYPDDPGEAVSVEANTLPKDMLTWARGIFYGDSKAATNWDITNRIAEDLLKAIAPKAKTVATDDFESGFLASLKSNIFVFSAAKTYTQYAEITALLTDNDGNKRSFQDFKDEVLKIHQKYNLQYLKTEYNNAVRTAQAAGKWKKFEAQKDLFDLQYDTAGDNKVRKDHAKLDGITLPVDHPFWDTYTPPLDFGCRCNQRQVAKGTRITPEKDLKGLPKPPKAFRFNPGKQGIIYSNKHPYIENLATGNKAELKAVKDYGLKEARAIYSRGKGLAKPLANFDTKDAALTWFTKKATEGILSLKARMFGQTIKTTLNDTTYAKITREGTKQNRWAWVNRIPNILLNANEVYLLDALGNSKTKIYRFIKYYKDKILITNVEAKGENFKVIEAYEASLTQVEKQRQGVLMYAKK